MLDTEHADNTVTADEGNGSTEPLPAMQEGKDMTNTHISGHCQGVAVVDLKLSNLS